MLEANKNKRKQKRGGKKLSEYILGVTKLDNFFKGISKLWQ